MQPTLLKSAMCQYEWFNIKGSKNEGYNKRKRKRTIEYKYVNTLKIVINFNQTQKSIVNKWFDDCIDVYNLTNSYIKQNINNSNIKELINFYSLRKTLNDQIKTICKSNKMNKHTAEYSVKHCVEMYKSSLSNHNNNFSKFNIKDLDKNRRRKNIVIEPASISTKINSFSVSQLGDIKTNINLNIIKQNSILQYDNYKKKYIIITPENVYETKEVKQYQKCGIDIGVRTFLTVYSPEKTYKIGPNTHDVIDKSNKKLDKLKSDHENKILSDNKFKKLYEKYSSQLRNRINDLHNKSANFLLSRYSKIIIGKVSTKKMISNLTGNLHKKVKRRLMALSHFRFRMKLKQMSVKYGTTIIEHDEHLTSKTCSNCKHIKEDLGANKKYKCVNCNRSYDRDINAAVNIFNEKSLKRSANNIFAEMY